MTAQAGSSRLCFRLRDQVLARHARRESRTGEAKGTFVRLPGLCFWKSWARCAMSSDFTQCPGTFQLHEARQGVQLETDVVPFRDAGRRQTVTFSTSETPACSACRLLGLARFSLSATQRRLIFPSLPHKGS